MSEKFHIRITEATRGRTYRPNVLEEYDFESDNVFKDVAEIISKQNVFVYSNGIYFEVKNERGQEEKFWATNRGDSTFTKYCTAQYGGFSSEYTDWNAKPKYLTCLDEETNEYKYYLMTFNEDEDNFNVQYGRIGMKAGEFNYADGNYSKDGQYEYPAPMFWIKYYEKISKGYEDKTELKDFDKQQVIKTTDGVEYAPIDEEKTRKIIEHLISQQRDYVQRSFDLTVPFSQKAIDISKDLLSQMNALAVSDISDADKAQEFKSLYKELVTALPRKIYDVSNYINRVDFVDTENENHISKVLELEQELLDNFCDIYETEKQIQTPEKCLNETVLQANGMQAQVADFKDKFDYIMRMGDDAHRVSQIIAVTNNRTKQAYEACKAEKGIKDSGCHLLWHGSRTENWWSIAKNGMSLNPNAVVTGKAFGQGLYFAPKAHKSMGYTDMRGSYWVGGSKQTGYLALFEVAMGKPYEPTQWLSGRFSAKDLPNNCHSTWVYPAKVKSLYNEECIVYDERQANMVALIEIDSSRDVPFRFDLKKAQELTIKNVEFVEKRGHSHIVAEVPKFSKSCPTLIADDKVSFDYDIDAKKFTLQTPNYEANITESERDFLSDVFMSKFCENEREFALIAEEIKALGDIPKDIKKQFEDKTKRKDKSYESRTA